MLLRGCNTSFQSKLTVCSAPKDISQQVNGPTMFCNDHASETPSGKGNMEQRESLQITLLLRNP